MFKPLILVPVFNHAPQFARFAPEIAATGTSVLVVDDGSDKQESVEVIRICAKNNFTLLRHEKNLGKGAAFRSGFSYARENNFSHVLQIDADGQHDAKDIPKFLELAKNSPNSLIAGTPIYDETVPAARKFGRKFTNFWCVIETRSMKISDAMCGFRVYPVEQCASSTMETRDLRMGFDVEIIVRLVWHGVPVVNVPTRIKYPKNGRSHYHAFRDNTRLSITHARLFLQSFFTKIR